MKYLLIKLAISVVALGCTLKSDTSDLLYGIWQSEGGGWVLIIDERGNYIEYDVTDISCLIAREEHVDEFGDRLFIEDSKLKLQRGVLEYNYVRSDELPEICREPVPEEKLLDPLYNFEVFTNTIERHYAFMELNKINFDSLYNDAKETLLANPGDITLYKVLDQMLTTLNDNHGSVVATDEIYEALEAGGSEDNLDEISTPEIGDFEIAGLVADHHLETQYTKDSFLMQWGILSNNIGYIQIKAMFLFADLNLPDSLIDSLGYIGAYFHTLEQMNEGAYIEKEAEGASQAMKKVMSDLVSTDAIVIDLRFNGGGQDAVSLQILKYFNSDDRVIANQKLVHNNGFSPGFDVILGSVEKPYDRPTFVLTSNQTGSAAEVFSLATIELPNVVRIGEPTMGALSTSLEKELPNGWYFSISNEIYQTLDGHIYENKGVPVDHPIEFNSGGRQEFFYSVKNNLDEDKTRILDAVQSLLKEF